MAFFLALVGLALQTPQLLPLIQEVAQAQVTMAYMSLAESAARADRARSWPASRGRKQAHKNKKLTINFGQYHFLLRVTKNEHNGGEGMAERGGVECGISSTKGVVGSSSFPRFIVG